MAVLRYSLGMVTEQGNFFGLKGVPMNGETVFQVSCLNSQSCKNNQPNCVFQGPLFSSQVGHMIVT